MGMTNPAPGRRKLLSKLTRFEVFKRDRFICQYCGAQPPGVLLEVDHIVAVAAGGGNTMGNLITACQPCNLGKGARDLRVIPQSLAEKAKETLERESQLAGYQEILEAKRLRVDGEVWRVFEVLYGGNVESVKRDEYSSMERFIGRLGLHACLEAAEIAMTAKTRNCFRYFCGICWNKVREVDS